jgi:hypothetical protein
MVLKSRVPRALPHALAAVCLLAATASARAAEPSPGGAAFSQARTAWESGKYETSETLYREALEKGGLAPDEVLEGYVRLGAVRAARGKKDQAIAAFRAASVLDASFTVPRQAGQRAATYADRARRDTQKIGSIQLSIAAPKEAPAGKSFKVTASLDKAHVPIVSRIGLVAKDGTTGKEAALEAKTDENVDFEIPADIALPSASIVVRVDALDSHANRLASAEERVKVPDAAVAVVPAVVAGPSTTTASASHGPAREDDSKNKKGGSFWATPWPYLIGTLAIAGAGAAVFFGTRQSDSDVSIGQVGVRAR